MHILELSYTLKEADAIRKFLKYFGHDEEAQAALMEDAVDALRSPSFLQYSREINDDALLAVVSALERESE